MKKGFTLIELVMVLSVMAIITSVALPSFLSMRQEAMYTKAQKEVTFLQSSVEKYWTDNGKLPDNLQEGVLSGKTRILPQQAQDPWQTDGKNYGYSTGKTASGEAYYVIYTKGVAESVKYEVNGDSIVNKGGNVIVSNLPVLDE
jgi:prepilin-type N-terminal cleavage/methylation domain-containing protein